MTRPELPKRSLRQAALTPAGRPHYLCLRRADRILIFRLLLLLRTTVLLRFCFRVPCSRRVHLKRRNDDGHYTLYKRHRYIYGQVCFIKCFSVHLVRCDCFEDVANFTITYIQIDWSSERASEWAREWPTDRPTDRHTDMQTVEWTHVRK